MCVYCGCHCNNPTLSHIYIGDPDAMSNTNTLTLQHIGTKKPSVSSARCGTSHFTGPSATEAKTTLRASLGNRLHRADPLPCSHTGPLCVSLDNTLSRTDSLACSLGGSLCLSGQQAVQDGLTRLQPRQISMHLRTTGSPGRTHSPAASADLYASLDNRLSRTDSLACSLAGSLPLWTTGCPGRTHSPAASPDLYASLDNRLPRKDSLACSLAGSPCLSWQPTVTHDGCLYQVAALSRSFHLCLTD